MTKAFAVIMASLAQSQSPSLVVASGVLFLGAFLFYRWLLPKPITGIPYNTKATKSIFGDIPDMLEHLKHSKTVTDWMEAHVSNDLASYLDRH